MALVTKSFSDIITFTRASTGTFFNSAGVLTSASINSPRFDYNPVTLAAQGLLIEEARTNNYTYSAAFDDPAWTKTRSSITANAVVSPDGASNGDKLVEDTTASNSHVISQPFSFVSGTTYTHSIFVKQGERTALRILFPAAAFTSNLTANFDISTGAWRTTSPAPSAGLTLAVAAINNGWYKISVTATATATAASTILLYLLDSPSSSGIYTGDGTSGLYIWGAQLEAGAFPTSYIPTTTTALTRSADVASVNTLAPWYNATQGTLYSEASLFGFGTTPAVTSFSDGTDTGNLIQTNTSGAGLVRYRVTIGGVAQVNNLSSGVTATTNTTFKAATGYAASDFAISVNGTAAITQASGNVPTPTQLRLLQTGSGGSVFSGYLRRITYYPRRLSNVELQVLTAPINSTTSIQPYSLDTNFIGNTVSIGA